MSYVNSSGKILTRNCTCLLILNECTRQSFDRVCSLVNFFVFCLIVRAVFGLSVRRYVHRPTSNRKTRTSVKAHGDCDDDLDQQSTDEGICRDVLV